MSQFDSGEEFGCEEWGRVVFCSALSSDTGFGSAECWLKYVAPWFKDEVEALIIFRRRNSRSSSDLCEWARTCSDEDWTELDILTY